MDGALIQQNSCPYRKTSIWRQRRAGRTPCDDEGHDWSDAAASQGTVKIAANHQNLEEARKESPLQFSEGA